MLSGEPSRTLAGLPLLDMHAEYDRAVALTVEQEIMALALAYEADRRRIRAKFAQRSGRDDDQSWGGRFAIDREASVRFTAQLWAVHGLTVSPAPTT